MNERYHHGWIVISKEEGYKDHFHVEYMEGDKRIKTPVAGPTEAIEFFDKRVGKPVALLPTPIGAFRVYTNE